MLHDDLDRPVAGDALNQLESAPCSQRRCDRQTVRQANGGPVLPSCGRTHFDNAAVECTLRLMKQSKQPSGDARVAFGDKSSPRGTSIPRPPDLDDDPSGGRRAPDLARFSQKLNGKYSEARLRAWVNASAARRDSFEGLTFGTIRWPKSIGRPDSGPLAEGFVIDRLFYYDFWYIGLNGEIIEKDGWIRGTPPTVWDGKDDADHFRVNFLFNAGSRNRVEVSFSKAGWQRPGKNVLQGYRWMHPRGFEFESDRGLTFLPPIQIDLRLIVRS